MMKINIFWFRRDLRLNDNTGLDKALGAGLPVLPIFIFDTNIITELPADDPRINFIYDNLFSINEELNGSGSSVLIMKGDPVRIWEKIKSSFDINGVFTNKDYEPYAVERDNKVKTLLAKNNIDFHGYRDQVIFEENDIIKADGKPYTVFTPYKKSWLKKFREKSALYQPGKKSDFNNFYNHSAEFPSIEQLKFRKNSIKVRPFDLSVIPEYHKYRDIPAADNTSYLSPHLRFGTVSIRHIVRLADQQNQIFLNELIWREFFMQILYHFPHVVTDNFKSVYDDIAWLNDEKEFARWCISIS